MIRTGLTARRLASVLLGLGIAIMALGPLQAAEAARVKIENFTFEPRALSVKVGTVVVFVNEDDIPHVVVATDGSFRSKALDTGDSYAFTFTKSGDFPYFCALHPHMQGIITVSP